MSRAYEYAWIDRLLRPAAWPHPVGKIDVIETHISFVILTGDFAYKLKKSVNLGFLDFSTLDARRHFCREELRLNRRMAPQLYLDVIPIGGTKDDPRPGSDLGVFEYAVKMRQFDQSAQLDNVLTDGALSADKVDAVADWIAEFHAGAESCSQPDPADAALQPFLDNLRVLQETSGPWQNGQELANLDAWLNERVSGLKQRLVERAADGFVRDVHGDLHLRNLAWLNDEPVAFDCIEFSPALRQIDVMNDVAFAVMDLAYRNRDDLALRLLNRYLESSGDYEGLTVLDFYLAYRATVRAKVDAIRAGQEREPGLLDDCQRGVMQHLTLAERFVRSRSPRIVLTRGMSGSGKSYGSAQLLAGLAAVRVRSDIERKRLAGLPLRQRAGAEWGEGLYRPEMTKQTYGRLAELAELCIRSGRTVIVDATFRSAAERRRFWALSQSLGVPLNILDYTAPESVLRQRVADRPQGASDADLAVLDQQIASWEPLDDHEIPHSVSIDSSQPQDPMDIIARLVALPGSADLRDLAAGPWVVVDDGVMGGRSAGAVSEDDGLTVFSGTLSLENNGGFSSVRLPLSQSLKGYTGLRIKVRGDGRAYQLRLREGNRFDGVSWGTSFASSSEWTTVDIPFARFRPTFRGRAVPQAGPVVAERIGQIGILLGDKNPGAFHLEVAALEGIAAAGGK